MHLRKFNFNRLKGKILYPAIFIVGALLFTGIFETVYAVIGRPLTPYSYAGVARRTARRSAYYYDGYPYPMVPAGSVISTPVTSQGKK
jgi:hypothetical protein